MSGRDDVEHDLELLFDDLAGPGMLYGLARGGGPTAVGVGRPEGGWNAQGLH